MKLKIFIEMIHIRKKNFCSWNSIKKMGLSKMRRQHIHFAIGEPGAQEVISGMRKSCEIMIFIDLKSALDDGIKFYLSENKVVLSSGINGIIPPKYFKVETKNDVKTFRQKRQNKTKKSTECRGSVEKKNFRRL